MNKIRKILAPTDLSELSQVGIRYALKLARAIGAEVTVYHAVGYDEFVEYGQELERKIAGDQTYRVPSPILERHRLALARFLNDHFSDLLPWVKVREKVELGTADESIVGWAKKEGSDLIVISTHGRTGLSHMLLGSVTEKVVRHAPCPVLSIPAQPQQEEADKVAAVA